MLANLNDVLPRANKHGYAVGAFNINNLEILEAIMDAAEAEQAPVIISTSEGAIDYAGMEELAALVHIKAAKTRLPVVLHLDHGTNEELVKRVIRSGLYTSVMFDGSSLPFKENVKKTRSIVRMAHRRSMTVEAELGAIAGIEDFVDVSERDAHLTDPEQAALFAEKTDCDALAIAIGTSHGAYKFDGDSQLDFDRLKEIESRVSVPLVLHGASGIPSHIKKQCIAYGCNIADAKGVSDAHIKKSVRLGIDKINIDSDLRIAFDAGVRKVLIEQPEVFDPRKILGPAKKLMTKVVRQKMRMFGCSGQS